MKGSDQSDDKRRYYTRSYKGMGIPPGPRGSSFTGCRIVTDSYKDSLVQLSLSYAGVLRKPRPHFRRTRYT